MTEVETLRARLAAAEAELAGYRAAYDPKPADRLIANLRDIYGLTPAQGWLLAALYSARDRVLSHELLLSEIPGLPGCDPDLRVRRLVSVTVSTLRGRLGPHTIRNERGVGYVLTAKGRETVNAALERELAA